MSRTHYEARLASGYRVEVGVDRGSVDEAPARDACERLLMTYPAAREVTAVYRGRTLATARRAA